MGTVTDHLVQNKSLVVIAGPTASGKTAASVELSRLMDIEVISADSRQIYKYLDIGTAKASPGEIAAVPHHFIDIVKPDQYYSAGLFGDQAQACAREILARGRVPVVTGGSGLYIKALCEGLFKEDNKHDKDDSVKLSLENRLLSEGIEPLYLELVRHDQASALKYTDKNPRRIIRALDYFYSTGSPISLDQSALAAKRDFNVLYFGILVDRPELYDRINLRTERMWIDGLPEETRAVLQLGYSPQLNSLNTVGYKEAIEFLDGSLSKEQAIDKISRNTRRYAKRQMTWFRRVPGMHWIGGSPAAAASGIYKFLTSLNKQFL